MENKQFRQELRQMYNAGKVADGATAKEIADGMWNPVEQLNYIASKAGGDVGRSQTCWTPRGAAARILHTIANSFTHKG